MEDPGGILLALCVRHCNIFINEQIHTLLLIVNRLTRALLWCPEEDDDLKSVVRQMT